MIRSMFRIVIVCCLLCSLLLSACRGADRIQDNNVPLTVEDNYTVVSFEMLKNNPRKYSGTLIAIDVYLARDFDVLDTDIVSALYDKEFTSSREPALGSSKIGTNIIYASMLHRFGFNQWCRVFGVYYVPCAVIDEKELYSFIRIDRVESSQSVLKLYFKIESK